MAIIGFNFKKITAERKNYDQGAISTSLKLDIKEITPIKDSPFKDKEVFSFDFYFGIKYLQNKKEIAEVTFEGSVLYLADKDTAKMIKDQWKDKKLDDNLKTAILNTIMTKCNVKALDLEENLNLPFHLRLPHLQKSEKEKK